MIINLIAKIVKDKHMAGILFYLNWLRLALQTLY